MNTRQKTTGKLSLSRSASVEVHEVSFRMWKFSPNVHAYDNGHRKRIVEAGTQKEAFEIYFARDSKTS